MYGTYSRWVSALLLVAAGACGGGGSSGGSQGNNPGGGGGSFQTQVQGAWASPCSAAGNFSEKNTLTVSGNNFSNVFTTYANGTCSGAGTAGAPETGSFTVGSTVTASLGTRQVTATQIDGTSTAAGGAFYDLSFVDTGVTPNRWYLGLNDASHDGGSPATRPVALDDSSYLVRQ